LAARSGAGDSGVGRKPEKVIEVSRRRHKVVITMARITETLIVEHGVFIAVFDEIERVLPTVESVAETKRLAGLVEALLRGHSETETNLAYAALDHILEDRGELNQLHQDHQEIDARLRRLQSTNDCGEARRLLKAALRASREHFLREERTVFPLIDSALSPEAQTALGNACTRQGATQGLSRALAPANA
jgi:hemerythrin-like domain-containing protein